MDKSRRFPFSLRCRLLGSLAYRVQGRSMRPAHGSIKNPWATQPIPVPDNHRGIGIGVRLVSTTGADVGVFFPGIQSTAGMAGFAGVSGVDLIHRHTGGQRLVADEPLQLMERPEIPVLSRIRFRRLALLRSFAYPGQILKTNPRPGFYRQSHQCLADAMVDVRDNASFPLFQSFDRFVLSCGLQSRPAVGEYAADMPDSGRFPECHRPIGRGGCYGHILSPIHANPAAIIFSIGNFHRYRDQCRPDSPAGTGQFYASGFGLTFQHCLQQFPMGSAMHLQRYPFLMPRNNPKETLKVSATRCSVQFWLLVYSGKPKLPDPGFGVGIADGLVNPCRADLHIRKGLAGQFATICFRHRQDGIGNLRIHPFQTQKLIGLGLVEPQKGEFQCFGYSCHVPVLSNLAALCKIKTPDIPMAEVRGFTALWGKATRKVTGK